MRLALPSLWTAFGTVCMKSIQLFENRYEKQAASAESRSFFIQQI